MAIVSRTDRPSTLKRRKGVLMAGVFAMALTGVFAGQMILGDSHPAIAQTTTSHPMPVQAQMMSFADVVAKVKPAVVSVRVRTQERQTSQLNSLENNPMFRDLPPDHPLRRFFGDNFGNFGQQQTPRNTPRRFGMAQGSGFFISADGFAVTNNHVVENATEVELVNDEGKTFQAKVVGTDQRTDLAVLKVDTSEKLPFVSFSTNMPRVGDWVVAIGNPFGLGGSVTAGIISARGRDIGAGPYDDFLQIDAAVNRGNSGGPTFNLNGEVVGVNTAIYSPSGGNVGIAFAVPSEVATNVIGELKDNGTVTRGWLGVQIQTVTDDLAESLGLKDARGALVVEPQSGTPAQKAGIRAGDAIIAVNGEKVADARELSRKVASLKPGVKANFTVWRDGHETTIAVDLGRMPDEPRQARAGSPGSNRSPAVATLNDLGLELRAGQDGDGVVVSKVDPEKGVAERLRTGDVILEAGGRKVGSPSQVADAVREAREKGTRSVLFRVRSGEATRYVAVPVGRG